MYSKQLETSEALFRRMVRYCALLSQYSIGNISMLYILVEQQRCTPRAILWVLYTRYDFKRQFSEGVERKNPLTISLFRT